MKRFVIVVLDSVGVGAAPDAAAYACADTNTLGHVISAFPRALPCMQSLGLGNILPLAGVPPVERPIAAWGKMQPQGAGMDTTSGHWEIAGTPLSQPFPTFPKGFPPEIMEPFSAACGRGILGNYPASGVEIIQNLGTAHVESGKLIVYTSADSVFQLAAHEEIVPPEQLYAYCRIARELLQGKYAVGRVIARPFRDDGKGNYIRTENRRDFSLEPPVGNLLEACQAAGLPVCAVGKIYDIFAGKHIDRALPGHNNRESMLSLLQALEREEGGLIFANFVDFDMLYGHRNDAEGYANALAAFDQALPELLSALKEEDILAICADHGNDPTTPSSDHSRENVPLLLYGAGLRPVSLGTRCSFADLGQSAADYLGLKALNSGSSFLQEII
ncbi:MAG: phosphopentomutase [Bacillota bacterium]|nr:phosphopentomutase [Bacillota bacterium]